jgi:hypothetical protein
MPKLLRKFNNSRQSLKLVFTSLVNLKQHCEPHLSEILYFLGTFISFKIAIKTGFVNELVKQVKHYTVNDQIPDRPVFERSFSGHFLSPVFEWFKKLDRFSNVPLA